MNNRQRFAGSLTSREQDYVRGIQFCILRPVADQPVQDTTTLNVILKSGRVVALLDFKHESKQELVKLFQEGDSKVTIKR